MSYVVGNADVIKDPYVVEELQRIQAYLKGLTVQSGGATGQPNRPDEPIPTEKGDPDNPDRTTPSPTAVGVRWLTGPWLIGIDDWGASPMPSYAYSHAPGNMTADQHNYPIPDGVIVLEFYPAAEINLTGIRITKTHRRIICVVNRGSHTMFLVNQSTSSEAAYRFSWGDTGDAGETIGIPNGAVVWLIYSYNRWKLFALPAVGPKLLPPSLLPPEPMYWWRATTVTDGSMTLVSTLNTAAAYIGASGVTFYSTLGWGATRQTAAAGGSVEGVREAAGSGLLTVFDPIADFLIRTGSDIGDVRIWVILLNGGTSFNSDTMGGGAWNGVGFRYSTVAGDAGWVGVTSDAATQTVSAKVADIAALTVYRLRVRIQDSTAYFSVNGGTEVAVSTTMPDDATLLRWAVIVVPQVTANRELTFFRHWARGRYTPD